MNKVSHDFDRAPRDADEFLATFQDVDGRIEYVDGRVVTMMTNVTLAHYRTANRFVRQLAGLEDRGLLVGAADFGVQIGQDVRYPDVLVFEPADLDDTDRRTNTPLLIGEILSEATTHIDFGPKAEQYLSLGSLRHYVILAQDRANAWVWARGDGGAFGDPVVLKSQDETIELSAFDLEIPLSAIYR